MNGQIEDAGRPLLNSKVTELNVNQRVYQAFVEMLKLYLPNVL